MPISSLSRWLQAGLLAVAAMVVQPENAHAQFTGEGTLGWHDGVTDAYYSDPGAACAAQWEGVGMSQFPGSSFLGAFRNTQYTNVYRCSWTSYQYLCREENNLGPGLGAINYCGTILPSSVFFRCASGYALNPDGYCMPEDEFLPERPQCEFNNGAVPNPTAGNPVVLSTGAKTLTQVDFATADGLFVIARNYRSFFAGRSVGYRFRPLGLPTGWAFNFSYELQFREFSGAPSNPTARIALVTPDGSAFDFALQSNGDWQALSTGGDAFTSTEFVVEMLDPLPSDLSTLQQASTRWRVTDRTGRAIELETFPVRDSGLYRVARTVQIDEPAGYRWTLAYDADGALQTITDSFGRQATVSWAYFLHHHRQRRLRDRSDPGSRGDDHHAGRHVGAVRLRPAAVSDSAVHQPDPAPDRRRAPRFPGCGRGFNDVSL